MTIDNRNRNKDTCPVCEITLITQDDDNGNGLSEICPKCHRYYFPFPEDIDINTDSDIEPVSGYDSDNDSPILLCEQPKESKPDSYLRRHFGSGVTIESTLEIPE